MRKVKQTARRTDATADNAADAVARMYEETLLDFTEGSIVPGRVLAVRPDEILVDIGYKSEGTIPISEFRNVEEVKPGDRFEVMLEKLEDDDGMVVLSKIRADQQRKWENVVAHCSEGSLVEGEVKGRVKGGLIVDIGVDAFLPGSQIDLVPVRNADELIGQTLEFKILKINKERRNVVLSRRELLEERRKEQRRALLTDLNVGEIRKGVVKNITDFGAFVDLNGIDGLLHITDMSWGRLNHPSEMVTVGQELEVVVLEVDREKERISLGLKQRTPNPWDAMQEKYPIGSRIRGKVKNLTNYGAFVELDERVDGMIHVSDMSWTRKVNHPSEVLNKGDEVECIILEVDTANQRISLGLKQAQEDPWTSLAAKYRIGQIVKGKVSKIASFGAFVELDDGIDGLVHISQISEERVQKVRDVLEPGQEVEARVIKIDPAERQIRLSIKAVHSPDEALAIGEDAREGLRPDEDLVDLAGAFDEAFGASQASEEWRPGASNPADENGAEPPQEDQKE
jgi:small subunit ribosomal protein S1